MHKRSSRIAAAFFATIALGSIQGTVASAQYENCQYYSVTSCAGDKYIALGYPDRTSCYSAKYSECQNGGPIDAAQFKAEAGVASRDVVAHS